MKIAKSKLRRIIKEEVTDDKALLSAIAKLTDSIDGLDVSIDFLSAATIGLDPIAVGSGQKNLGRLYSPPPRRDNKMDEQEDMQDQVLCKGILETIEELKNQNPDNNESSFSIENQIDVLENLLMLKGCSDLKEQHT
tara:strand:+ start:422 stop:832 length:411 start_codon:yes stop_codon:yes gene_type:complete